MAKINTLFLTKTAKDILFWAPSTCMAHIKEPTPPSWQYITIYYTRSISDDMLLITHILYYEYYIINLPLPLKQSFRIRDYCLIIKSRTYLKILFFLYVRQVKAILSALRSWLVEPKIGAHLGADKLALGRHWLYYTLSFFMIIYF